MCGRWTGRPPRRTRRGSRRLLTARVQVVSLLARSGAPMTVKEIVAAVPVGQSTVSEHLRRLAAVGFVLAEERGTSRLYRINENCVQSFPTAADLVMGKPSPVPPAAAR